MARAGERQPDGGQRQLTERDGRRESRGASIKNVATLFEKFLRSRDLRLTRQRLEILRAMFATHKHVSAEDLYDLLKQTEAAQQLKISRATVYRTLALLNEGGFIEALDLGRDQGTLYEHVMGHAHHDHMVCQECGKIIEFHDDELERVQAAVVKRHGFHASSHRLNVYGVCARCAAADDHDEVVEGGC